MYTSWFKLFEGIETSMANLTRAYMNWRFTSATFLALAISVPGNAQQKAASPAAIASKPAAKPAQADDEHLLRNADFGFRYQIPYGWVDRTQQMPSGNEEGKAKVLLAVFERPPEATGDTVNSAVVIASESAASYPGLKRAEDYVGLLTQLATAKGFTADGEAYPLEVEGKQLVRADFVKTASEKLTMHQCTLILLAKGQIVSFTFIAGSDDELDDLMDRLHFYGTKSTASNPPKPHKK